MSRWQAAVVHLVISIIVAGIIGLLLAASWYPPDYWEATGVLKLFGILLGVQICFGPLLTLIIFKSGKTGLKFDLAAITVVQALALSYGLYTLFLARPVYMVFTIDRFELVTAAEIPPENIAKTQHSEYPSLPVNGPRVVAVKRPDDPQEREKILFSAAGGGADLQHFPQYYQPYPAAQDTVIAKGLPLNILLQRGENARQLLTALLAKQQLQVSQVLYLPLKAKIKDQTILIDKNSAAVLAIANIDPW